MAYPAEVKKKSTLLRQKGYSLNEVVSEMKIAKSTASVWLKNLKLNNKAKEILLKKKNDRFFKPHNTEWMKGKKTKPRIWTKQKLKLLKGYYNSGLNMLEVAKRMGVTGSTINHTMRRNNIPRRTFSEAYSITFSKKLPSYKKKANLSSKEKYLHAATLMLYWAEGAKGRHSVDFANSDGKMVTLFLKGLREIYRVDEKRLRVCLYCYANQNVSELLDYWSSLLNIPKNQFIKPYIRKDYSENKIGKMVYGVIHIRYSDKKLLMQIKAEIDIMQKELNRLGWRSGQSHFSVKEMSERAT